MDKCIFIYNPENKSYVIHWEFDENGIATESHVFSSKPTLEEIKKIIHGYYNLKCEKEIVSGLQYEGSTVWLSIENQINYKAVFDLADKQDFKPVIIKLGNEFEPVYKTFENYAAFEGFVNTCFQHIQTTLKKYWDIKNSIDWNKYTLE